MRHLLIILLFTIPNICFGQPFASFLNYVDNQPDSIAKATAIDSFMNEFSSAGFPYIDADTANFIYRGNASSVDVAGDFNGWQSANGACIQISQTNLWYRSVVFEPNARMDYKIVLNGGNWILDPLNPNTVSGGFGPNSELAMPAYIQPWEINEFTSTQKGTMSSFNLASTNTGATYQVQVYLPAGYDPAGSITYPVAYFQDGQEYVTLGSAKNIFDNLIDSNLISATIGIFVRPNNRNDEYAGTKRDSYRLFFVNELIPYVDANYKTFAAPSRRAVIGASFGGNISALISYNHPEVFGNCGLHSGAFWPNGNEAYNLIVNATVKDIKFASVWGTYEGTLTDNMENFKDQLLADNYQFWWNKLPEGHSWGLWRATTDDLLKFLFPVGLTAIEHMEVQTKTEISIHPNPVSTKAMIRMNNPDGRKFLILVYDSSGQEVQRFYSNQSETEFRVDHLSTGKYYVDVKGYKADLIIVR